MTYVAIILACIVSAQFFFIRKLRAKVSEQAERLLSAAVHGHLSSLLKEREAIRNHPAISGPGDYFVIDGDDPGPGDTFIPNGMREAIAVFSMCSKFHVQSAESLASRTGFSIGTIMSVLRSYRVGNSLGLPELFHVKELNVTASVRAVSEKEYLDSLRGAA